MWDKTKPAIGTNLQASHPEILANWSAIEAALGTQVTGVPVAISAVQWGYLGGLDQALTQASTPTFAGADLGGQIKFPATQVPSADANTLDDYEEGTWTPGIAFGEGTVGITYNETFRYGKYTKIGNIVFFTGIAVLTSKGTSVGSATITGLPFTIGSNSIFIASIQLVKVSFANQQFAKGEGVETVIHLYEVTEAGAMTVLNNADFADDSDFSISGFYFI